MASKVLSVSGIFVLLVTVGACGGSIPGDSSAGATAGGVRCVRHGHAHHPEERPDSGTAVE